MGCWRQYFAILITLPFRSLNAFFFSSEELDFKRSHPTVIIKPWNSFAQKASIQFNILASYHICYMNQINGMLFFVEVENMMGKTWHYHHWLLIYRWNYPSIGRNIDYDLNDVLQVHRFLLSQQLFLSHLIQTTYLKWYLGCALCTTGRNVLKCCENKHVFWMQIKNVIESNEKSLNKIKILKIFGHRSESWKLKLLE